MSEVQLSDTVKNAIDSIVSNEKYEIPPEIDVMRGSETGDGYSSKTYVISIKSKNRKTVKLFVKELPGDIVEEWKEVAVYGFQIEFRFYQEIYPILHKFQEEKNIKEPFNNVPKHYGANTNRCEHPAIILENLRCLGYTLWDRKKPIDDAHLKLPIETFAKYHAVSFALKDQQPEEFRRISAGIVDFFSLNFRKALEKMVGNCIDQFVNSLDPVTDKKLLDHCKNLIEVLSDHVVNIPSLADEYAVIGQGDSWVNNMMFLYDKETKLPVDVKLLDWQCIRVNSPLLDFSYFFYTLADKKALDNAEYYLNLYYDTLSQSIRELGSDPKQVFPYEAFMEHWRKFSLFGLTMAFYIVRVLLFDKDEVPVFITETGIPFDSFSMAIKKQDKYVAHMKDVVEYFIDKGLL